MGNKRSTSHAKGRPRTKRPDRLQGDEKQRVAGRKKWNEKCTVQDLRVTRVQKKKEREVLRVNPARPMLKKKSDLEVKVRALNKLLASIRALKARAEAGEVLNESQLTKVGREEDVAAELAQFLTGQKQ